MTASRSLVDQPSRRFAAAVLAVVLIVAVYTVVSLLVPAVRLQVSSSGLRVVIEVVGVCALLFAALAMALPGERDLPPASHAIIAALVVIAIANAAFGVGPYVLGGRLPGDHGLAFYPWVASRHVAGLLFIAAALQRPRLGLRLTFGWALFAFITVELAVMALRERLVLPVVLSTGEPALEVVAPAAHVVLQAVPAVLFGVGSWLAGRLYRATGVVVLLWVSLALTLQVLAQLHEILYPALLGPVVTSADVLRLGAFALLLVGAVAQLRHLYVLRSRTVRVQARDIDHQARLVDELGGFAEKEELFRSIVAHELATPIATIRNYTELIAARLPEDLPPDLDAALADMRTEANRLLELVGRIDELRSFELDHIRCELRPVRLRPLLDEAQRFVHGLDGTHPVLVDCPDARVLADPVRLGQLLRNLLVNAVRFSPAGLPIELIGRPVAAGFELRIRDGGPGIPAGESKVVEVNRYTEAGPGEPGSESLSRIRQHPEAFDGRQVSLRGKAGETFLIGGNYVFQLRQGRDTIVVYSRTRRPSMHESVLATGTISIGYLDGVPRLALIEDKPAP